MSGSTIFPLRSSSRRHGFAFSRLSSSCRGWARGLDLLKAGRGVDPRQQTLRATIEWSYELLAVEEQRLFARLAVFRGGCTLETVEEICDADLALLQSLVDKSLVRVRDAGRFWMLESITEFAAERLDESSDAEQLRHRHAEYFLALARRRNLTCIAARRSGSAGSSASTTTSEQLSTGSALRAKARSSCGSQLRYRGSGR